MYKIKIFLKSFLSLFAVMRLTGMTTKNPLSAVLLFVFIYVFSKLHSDKIESRIISGDIVLSSILSALFTLFTLSADYHIILGGLSSRLFCLIILILTAVGLFTIYYYLCLWLLQAVGALKFTHDGYSTALLPYIASAVCFVCWIPYFLFEYPAVMTPDSINQYAQVIGAYELSNHHSIIHTLIIGACYNAGLSLTGNVYVGIAFYTVLQMIFMAFVAGYVVRTLQKAKVKTLVIIISICFYALMPYNGAYVVTMWKDIPFAGFMTLFAAGLMRFLIRNSEDKLSVREYFTLLLPYIVSAFMICVLRTNGWYLFLVSLPFILVSYRKSLKLMIPVHVIILLLVLFIKYPVMQIYDIKQADFAESLSIPVQQIARVVTNGEPLSQSQYEFVSQIMDIEQVPSVYQEDVSDNIKNLIRQSGLEYLEAHKGEFMKNWLTIGLNHPKTYFDAYAAQTKGYWYPDVSCEVGLADGIYTNEFGLSWQPVIRGNILVKLKEITFKLPELIPLYGLMWSMGFMLWLILVIAALGLRNRNSKNALICLPFLLLTATLSAATPVANEFRYAYAIFYALPILLMSPFVRD